MENIPNWKHRFANINVLLKITYKFCAIFVVICVLSLIWGVYDNLTRFESKQNTSRGLLDVDEQILNCPLVIIPFSNGIKAEFCETSPTPVLFVNYTTSKSGRTSKSIPVLIAQAIAISLISNITEKTISNFGVDIQGYTVNLSENLRLTPKSNEFNDRLKFIQKWFRIGRV